MYIGITFFFHWRVMYTSKQHEDVDALLMNLTVSQFGKHSACSEYILRLN